MQSGKKVNLSNAMTYETLRSQGTIVHYIEVSFMMDICSTSQLIAPEHMLIEMLQFMLLQKAFGHMKKQDRFLLLLGN